MLKPGLAPILRVMVALAAFTFARTVQLTECRAPTPKSVSKRRISTCCSSDSNFFKKGFIDGYQSTDSATGRWRFDGTWFEAGARGYSGTQPNHGPITLFLSLGILFLLSISLFLYTGTCTGNYHHNHIADHELKSLHHQMDPH